MQERCGPALGMVFLDGTVIRAHKAAGARKDGRTTAESAAVQALGRSRGGYGRKGHVLADASGRAIGFLLTPGQEAELPQAVKLLEFLPGTPVWTVADRGYSSHDCGWPSGISAPGQPSRPEETRWQSPVSIGSTSIASGSSGYGAG